MPGTGERQRQVHHHRRQPSIANVGSLWELQASNVRVRVTRVRVNDYNEGAPRSRNRGLGESSAEWVLFLDDDVVLTPECLRAYVDRIARGDAHQYAGFIGTTMLPETSNILHEGTRMSDITFFFDLPPWMGDHVPRGVTANFRVAKSTFRFFRSSDRLCRPSSKSRSFFCCRGKQQSKNYFYLDICFLCSLREKEPHE